MATDGDGEDRDGRAGHGGRCSPMHRRGTISVTMTNFLGFGTFLVLEPMSISLMR